MTCQAEHSCKRLCSGISGNFMTVLREGSDYFTENFQVKENKTKMRNIHLRFFHLLFWGLRLGLRLGFGLGFDLGIVLE